MMCSHCSHCPPPPPVESLAYARNPRARADTQHVRSLPPQKVGTVGTIGLTLVMETF